MSATSFTPPKPAMVPTRWTLVLRSRGHGETSQQALSELCEAYYPVVEDFIRRETSNCDSARDLTHEFFARVLSGSGFGGAEQQRGRFRSYLFGAVKHFLRAQSAHRQRLKRGGLAQHMSIDVPGDETNAGVQIPDPGAEAPTTRFDRQWATTMLSRAMDRLGRGMASDGKLAQFEQLKPFLQGGGIALEPRTAAEMGMSPGALKVAIHRLRRRFKDCVRQEIAETLNDASMVEEEMKHLLEALRGS